MRKEIAFRIMGIRSKVLLFFLKPIYRLVTGHSFKHLQNIAKTCTTVEAEFYSE